MPTNSENVAINPSEALAYNDRALSPVLTNFISGVTYGYTYDKSSTQRPPNDALSPIGLVFNRIPLQNNLYGSAISNGYASAVNGITDFTAYNDYIHYTAVGGIGRISETLGNAGISNVGGNVTRFNVYSNLKKATAEFRFEIYNRQYRV